MYTYKWFCFHFTHRNLFQNLLDQTKIWLYSPFCDWFKIKMNFIWVLICRKIINTIWFRLDVTRCGRDFWLLIFSDMQTPPAPNHCHICMKDVAMCWNECINQSSEFCNLWFLSYDCSNSCKNLKNYHKPFFLS